MFEKMVPKKQGQRVKQLTKDTALALAYTSRGLVELTKHLLSTSHEYVCLGNFSSDPIEKIFLNYAKVLVEHILLMFNKFYKK